MICTCTLNPSLDYYMEFSDPVELKQLNRSNLEYFEAGGKGINVSIVLNNLQIPTRAFGFLGGFTREFYIQLLQKYEFVRPNFTYVEGITRINVKLMDQGSDTELNAQGPYITNDDMQNLKDKVDRLAEGDYLVLGGSCQEYLQKDVKEMLINSIENGVRVVLDTKKDLIDQMLPHHPFMVKLTEEDKDNQKTKEEWLKDAVSLYEKGAQHVLGIYQKKEAFLVCKEGCFVCDLKKYPQTVSMVGVNDALTAGFLMNFLRGGNAVDSFRFGACCGIATSFSKGLATREKIEAFYDETTVTKLENL